MNTKPLYFEKVISKNELKDALITKWLKPKGYDLAMTSINSEVFAVTVNLVYGKYDEFKKFIKEKHGFDTEFKDCVAMCLRIQDNGVTWHYVLIQKNEWYAENYGTICHELHHLTHFVLDDKGIVYCRESEEVFAYVQGFFMEMVVRAFMELKKANNKKK